MTDHRWWSQEELVQMAIVWPESLLELMRADTAR
jgi:hypothetical protein